MTGRLEMSCKLLPFRESHEGRVVRASTPSAVPHNETRASKPACTVGADIQTAVQHLRIQLGHIKGDKSTSSSQGQLAARRVSGGGGKRSRWPLLKFTGPPFWRSPLQLWLPSEVFSTRMAGGPGSTRHPQATTFGGPLLPLWTHGPGLVVGTGVAPPPARSPRAYRCEQGVNVDGCTRNPLMGTRGTFPDPVNPLTGCAKPLTGRQR